MWPHTRRLRTHTHKLISSFLHNVVYISIVFAPLGSRKENGTTRLLADVPLFFSPPKMIIIARKAVTVGGNLSLSLSLFLRIHPYKCVALVLSPSYNILRLIIMRRCMNHLVRSVIVAISLYCCGDGGNDDASDDDDDADDSYTRRRRRLQKNIYRVPERRAPLSRGGLSWNGDYKRATGADGDEGRLKVS